MEKIIVVVLVSLLCAVVCKPLDADISEMQTGHEHTLRKRYINSGSFDVFPDHGFSKMRTRRSPEEECEKLQLCKLHARSSSNFFSAFQLYFVNKENARLWDHKSHSMADCHRRFSCYRR